MKVVYMDVTTGSFIQPLIEINIYLTDGMG